MATKVLMPQLGESVTEGTIFKWVKQVGDQISKYETLCEVETDKVNAEVPSTISGVLKEIVAEDGSTVAVGETICYIEEKKVGDKTKTTSEEKVGGEEKQKSDVDSEESDSMKKRYSPVVLKIAEEHDIDLSNVKGTGLNSRITRKDILQLVENRGIAEPLRESMSSENIENKPIQIESVDRRESNPTSELENPSIEKHKSDPRDTVIEASTVRKTIAKRMVLSKHEAPHAWMTVEADVTELVNLRNKLKQEFKEKEGFSLTFLPFFIKAAVEAIKEYPILNSVWDEDKIILKKRINVSIAVATDEALFVPVIKDADQKSIYGIAKEIDNLARKTREGKLSIEDTQGGTFTMNNTGTFGSVMSAPIINYPQAAILTMEAIVKKPVIHDDMIATRSMVNLCISLDHRILDGLVVGRFMQLVKAKLENMSTENMNIY